MKDGLLGNSIVLKCISSNRINETRNDDINSLFKHFKVLSKRNITLFGAPDNPRHTDIFLKLAELGKCET